MKLLAKFNRVNVVATIIVLLLSGICYYILIRAILINQLNQGLKGEEQEVIDFVKANGQLPEPSDYKDEKQFFVPTNLQVKRSFSSVFIFDKERNGPVYFRQLQFMLTIAGKEYKVTVMKSQQETEDIIKFILQITLILVLLLLVTLFVINRLILSKLWKPFHNTMQQLNEFNLSGKKKVQLDETDIDEFAELNTAVKIMTNRVIADYNEIKSFTENASHEIQTPLAIIKSKLELLSQSETLAEEQMNIVQSIHEAVNRLSKLNQSLILLTKIDNRQFTESEEVDPGIIINKNLRYYEELIAIKNISVTKQIEANITVVMNETLAEILIANLITNAIKHNVSNGTITIQFHNKTLLISNTGPPLTCDPLELFERFKKGKVSSESLGLGLSIAKKICDRYHFKIYYTYSDLHQISVHFF